MAFARFSGNLDACTYVIFHRVSNVTFFSNSNLWYRYVPDRKKCSYVPPGSIYIMNYSSAKGPDTVNAYLSWFQIGCNYFGEFANGKQSCNLFEIKNDMYSRCLVLLQTSNLWCRHYPEERSGTFIGYMEWLNNHRDKRVRPPKVTCILC